MSFCLIFCTMTLPAGFVVFPTLPSNKMERGKRKSVQARKSRSNINRYYVKFL